MIQQIVASTMAEMAQDNQAQQQNQQALERIV